MSRNPQSQTLHERFIEAIHEKKKVRITFAKSRTNEEVVRVCAPLDFGPKRSGKQKKDLYHLWRYGENGKKAHAMSLDPQRVSMIEVMDEDFKPEEFVTWIPDWWVQRDWGDYS